MTLSLDYYHRFCGRTPFHECSSFDLDDTSSATQTVFMDEDL